MKRVFNLSTAKRKVAVLIVLGLFISLFASCDSDDKQKETNSVVTSGETSPADAEGEVTAASLAESLYGDYDFKGAKLRILAIEAGNLWYSNISDTANEVWFEENSSDVLERSIYERNRKTEELLNVEITPVWGGAADKTREMVDAAALTAQDDFDLAMTSLAELMTSASNGYLLNLNDIQAFDSDHTWWNENFVDNITLFGTDLYVIAGAINIWDDCSNNVLVFNKDYLESYNCDDPYQQVFDGTWTIDNQRATMQKSTQDLNGDGEMDDSDGWGCAGIGILLYNGMFGCDTTITHMTSEGVPEIVCNTADHINKVQAFFDTVMNSDAFYEQGIAGETSYLELFEKGQSGMMYANLATLFTLRNMEDEYGVLPLAKYNEQQENYAGSVNGSMYTVYGIPKNCTDPEMAAVCLETMSAYSVGTLDKNLHEILFETKLTRDKESREVLEILKGTISFDWSYVGDWRGNLVGIYDIKSGWPFTLASKIEAEYESANARLDEMIDNFRRISDN